MSSQYCEKSHWPSASRMNMATVPSASATTQRDAHATIDRMASFSFTLRTRRFTIKINLTRGLHSDGAACGRRRAATHRARHLL